MSEIAIRNIAKAVLPIPVRGFLRGCLHYFQRVGRWPIILWQVRRTIRGTDGSCSALPWHPPSWQSISRLNGRIRYCLPIEGGCKRGRQIHGSGTLRRSVSCAPVARTRHICRVARPIATRDTFIDAGANIGVYSVLAARLVGPDGKVIAVEMMPDTADRLEHNLELNGIFNVAVCRAALSNTVGEIVTAKVTLGKYGQASIAKGIADNAALSIQVKTTTLDELSNNLTEVRLIKMDLEGAEAVALLGAKALLDKADYLICEILGRTRSGDNPVQACLGEAGFTVRFIDGNNLLAQKTRQTRQGEQGIPQ